jgi:hypothetical protein
MPQSWRIYLVVKRISTFSNRRLKRELNEHVAPKDEDMTDDDASGDGSFSNWDYGFSIQDMPEALTRDRYFFASNSIPNSHFPYVFSRYRYVDGKWKFEEDIMRRDVLMTIEPKQ